MSKTPSEATQLRTTRTLMKGLEKELQQARQACADYRGPRDEGGAGSRGMEEPLRPVAEGCRGAEAMRFEPPTIAWRGQLANLVAAVQRQKPEHGEKDGTMRCACGATLHWNIQASGISRARCSAACGMRWCR